MSRAECAIENDERVFLTGVNGSAGTETNDRLLSVDYIFSGRCALNAMSQLDSNGIVARDLYPTL